jgi:hypothetical protein
MGSQVSDIDYLNFLTSNVVNQQEAKKRQTLLDILNRPIIRWKFMVKINHRLMDCEVMTMRGSIHHVSLTSKSKQYSR